MKNAINFGNPLFYEANSRCRPFHSRQETFIQTKKITLAWLVSGGGHFKPYKWRQLAAQK